MPSPLRIHLFFGGRLFMSLFVDSFIFIGTTPLARADYTLPLEGGFGSLGNFCDHAMAALFAISERLRIPSCEGGRV